MFSRNDSKPPVTPPAASNPPELPPEEAQKRAMLAKQAAAALGEIVSLLMRSQVERQLPLSDIEWMVMPAITTGQYVVADAQSKTTGAVMPVGAVLWALVSDDLDRQLANNLDQPVRLAPQDWRSGENPWVVLAIGDPKIVGGLLQNLAQSVFKGRPAKMRARGPDGKMVAGRIEIGPAQAATA